MAATSSANEHPPAGLLRLVRRRRDARIGHTLLWRPQVDSTNSWLRRQADLGAREGTLAVARAQSCGRGRLGRSWESPPGLGIYCSVLLQPRLEAARLGILPLAAGIAAAQAVRRAARLQTCLKWPNDLLIGRRKVGGILVEGASRGGRQDFVIVGWGLNLRQQRTDFSPSLAARSTSVRLARGRLRPWESFLAWFLSGLEKQLTLLEAGESSTVLARFGALCPSIRDTRLRILIDGRWRHATSRGLAEDGSLLVDLPEGQRRLHGSEPLRILR
ncbi:MAG: biotin--[acetyl-CoA-carboxylase] ligase [Acidobacteria bacterium]|nr:biotin--[acetyl-CoA-carboxylase] ligase [Acidobacteriota bacterium]